jgi:hypothetical protein
MPILNESKRLIYGMEKRGIEEIHQHARVVGHCLTRSSALRVFLGFAPYRSLIRHDKTGTCQRQNPLANASEPAPRSLAYNICLGVGRAARSHKEHSRGRNESDST